jgi:acyl-CoA synthetase (AMP-forming)/AMP-acid ligase II
MTFAEVDRAVRGVAAGLRGLGLPAGARVMIRMGSSAAAITAAPESCIRNAASPAVSWGEEGCATSPARVMIRMGNDADYVIVYFAALAAGLVAQPSSPQTAQARRDAPHRAVDLREGHDVGVPFVAHHDQRRLTSSSTSRRSPPDWWRNPPRPSSRPARRRS